MDNMDQILNQVGGFVNYILIGLGVIFFAFGIAFLIVNRKMIKLLYFVSGAQIFATLTFLIGSTIIYSSKAANPSSYTPIYILLGCTVGIGLLGSILAVVFPRFGILLIGLSGGLNVWQLAAGFIQNNTINLVLSIVFALVGALLCGFFKNPMEIIIAAFTGAHLFTKGLYLTTQGSLNSTKLSVPQITRYLFYAMIAEVALKALIFIINATIHLMRYFSEQENEEEVEPESQPMLEQRAE